MKRISTLAALLAILLSTVLLAHAQFPAPPPGAEVVLRSDAELDQLLGPIALYPDPLIAEILPAATAPSEIVIADRFVRAGSDPNLIDQQPWSASVKALARYPNVLQWMDDNLAWTTETGQAFLAQPGDVMNAIQRLRGRAQALGNLQTTPQQQVIADQGTIEIVPANPEVIYVPVYQPQFVYAQPGLFLTFGTGFALGGWMNHDFDWHHHNLIVWRRDQFRPRDWWYRPPAERHGPVIRGNPGVWHPRTRPDILLPGRGDRGWNVPPRRPEPPREVRPPPREPVRPAPRPPEPRREPPPPVHVPPPAAPRSVPHAAAVAPHEALIGVHSARDTHDFSSRGQQSRQAVSPPPAPRAPAPPRPAAPPAPGPSRGQPDRTPRRP